MFEYWASILNLRKSHKDIFIYGDFNLVDAENEEIFAYTRTFEGECVLIVANFKIESATMTLPPGGTLQQEKLLISNYEGIDVEGRKITLRSFEAFACVMKA